MRQITTVKDMKSIRRNLQDKKIGFVPTMGALHDGHLSLIKKCRDENEIAVVSIYLNETQFNDVDDFKNYPTSLEDDLKKLKLAGVDSVFLPNYQEMYPQQYRYRVHETLESKDLCGKDRPGHFDGVLTVVLKLLNIVEPTQAYFGEKDYQQLSLIQGMVQSFFLNTKIVGCPTTRNSEGLALSSRNKKLNENELKKATFFAQQLKMGSDLQELKKNLEDSSIEVDYLKETNNRRFAAVRIGSVRLIDNVKI